MTKHFLTRNTHILTPEFISISIMYEYLQSPRREQKKIPFVALAVGVLCLLSWQIFVDGNHSKDLQSAIALHPVVHWSNLVMFV